MRRIGVVSAAVATVIFSISGGFVEPRDKAALRIAPGPGVMSEDEKAIVADPSKGVEHAVILSEETESDESMMGMLKISYHLRAKILSSEGRSLAEIEIPVDRSNGELRRWWGKTLFPDGTSRELKEPDVKEQEVVRYGMVRSHVLRGVLPSVTPGCVIDLGWVTWIEGTERLKRVPLQQKWPVREFRYRWYPWGGLRKGYHVSRAEKFNVEVFNEDRALLIVARDLTPVVEEPFMRPESEARAAVTFYYLSGDEDPDHFWKDESRRAELRAKSFLWNDSSLKAAIRSMKFAEGADLQAKLKVAYDWLSSNVKIESLMTAEEMEGRREDDRNGKDTANDVLEAKEGSERQLACLFLGFARALGAEASLVLAADRTDHFWDPEIRSMNQFDSTIVAVRAPGDPDEKATFVDPASGLPYGEVRWWLTGVNGLLANPKDAREILIWHATATHNVSDTRADILFTPDGAAAIRWLRSGTGQQGYLERRGLRQLPPAERKKRLDEMCGAQGPFEVSTSEISNLEDLKAKFLLRCEGELAGAGRDRGSEGLGLRFDGPWMPPVPELASPTRTYPVIFPFPRIDRVTIEAAAPAGYGPKEAPSPVKIEGPYGTYSLTVEVKAGGYRVQRDFALFPLAVKLEEYPVLRKYLEDVRTADRTPLVFSKSGVDPS